MEKRSPDRYPNILTPEERRSGSTQSVEDSQKLHLASNRNQHSFKKDDQNKNESVGFTQKALQLPPIVTKHSLLQHNHGKYNRLNTSSNDQHHTPFIIENKRPEPEDSTSYSDLSVLLEKYNDDSTLLKLSLSKKIEEDRRKAEEAKLKHNYLDYLLSLDLTNDISNSSTKITQERTVSDDLEKSVASYCKQFNSENILSKEERELNISSYREKLNNSMTTNTDISCKTEISHEGHRKACTPSFNIEYINTESSPQRSSSSGALKTDNYHNSINQLYSPYKTQSKRNRIPEESTFQSQTTKKAFSYNNQETSKVQLVRKCSDPVILHNRSISKKQSSSDVSSVSSLVSHRFSRHLSVPDLQHPSGSTISNAKNLNVISAPASVGSSSSRSVSPSSMSELSIQSNVYSSRKDNELMETDERRGSFYFEAERQQNDNMDIDQERFSTSNLTKKERVLLPRIEMPLDTHHNIPNPSTKQVSPLSIETQADRISSEYSRSKGKKREMHAITMIVETAEFPYQDHYIWKNNGNTIHKNSGQKSIYYKCSNCIEGCPVNKTVMFKEDGSYLIKYRGRHIDKCNNEKAGRVSS